MNQSKKILFIVQSFGGIIEDIACLFKSDGNYSLGVLEFSNSLNSKNNTNIDRYYFKTTNDGNINFIQKAYLALVRTYYLCKLINRYEYEVLIPFSKECCVPTVLTKLLMLNTKIITAIRGNPKVRFAGFEGRMSAFVYRFADVVVTNSKASAHICRNKYGLKNTITIYNPVNFKKIRNKLQESIPQGYSDIFKSGKVFINVGRLSPVKGQWHLIRAFKKVVKDYPEVKLVILGEGILREKLEDLIKKCKLEDNVFLLGNQENVFSFLKAANCFVFSSLNEGLPNALLEAKTVGLPIISTDCETGPREILAPEVAVDKEISYPYMADDGTLVKPLSGNKIYKNTADHPLEPAEQMLAKSMLKQAGEPTPKKEINIDKRFDSKTVVKQWKRII